MACLDDDTITAFFAGALAGDEVARIEQHLDVCEVCRQLVSRVATVLEDPIEGRGTANGKQGASASTMSVGSRLATRVVSPITGPAESDDPGPISPGTRVDQFQVLRLVGQGGMGRVYQALDTSLGRQVALKVIHPRFVGSRQVVGLMTREARATAKFNHPHIVSVYGVGEYRGHPYVAFEFLDGQTLRERLREGTLERSEALRIGLAVAEALAEAHRHGILHRDLKPSNVMIPLDQRVRVLDFGLAEGIAEARPLADPVRVASDDPSYFDTFVTLGDGLLGTPAYMSPEQWLGSSVTEAADMWALGLTLHEMFAGAHPYRGPAEHDLARQVISGTPVPTQMQHELPALSALIRSCLDKDANSRPSAEEVVRTLRRVLHALPQTTPRRRWAWLSVGVLVLLGAAVSLGLAMVGEQTEQVTDPGPTTSMVLGEARLQGAPAASEAQDVDKTTAKSKGTEPRPSKRRARRSQATRRPDRRSAKAACCGTLVIQTHLDQAPMWGNVYLDGVRKGQTPLTLRGLRLGRHRVTVRRPGFATRTRKAVIERDQTVRLRIGLSRR